MDAVVFLNWMQLLYLFVICSYWI